MTNFLAKENIIADIAKDSKIINNFSLALSLLGKMSRYEKVQIQLFLNNKTRLYYNYVKLNSEPDRLKSQYSLSHN